MAKAAKGRGVQNTDRPVKDMRVDGLVDESPFSSLPFDPRELLELIGNGVTIGALKGHSPELHEAMYTYAHGQYVQGRYADALKIFGFLVQHDHLDGRFHMGFGACLHMLNRHEEALKYYGAASLFDLTDPEPVVRMAECQLALARPEQALEALRYAAGLTEGDERYAQLDARVQILIASAQKLQHRSKRIQGHEAVANRKEDTDVR